jgi:hypothetical protein
MTAPIVSISSDLTFITNEQGKHLSQRFGVLLGSNTRFFDCLVGYFFISGFHKLHPALSKTEKIRILVGIKTDRATYELIQTAKEQQEFALESHAHVRQQLPGEILSEFQKSGDSSEVENGVRKFVEWIKSGKLEVRAYPSERLHAKLYVMTFVDGHIDKGRVITGPGAEKVSNAEIAKRRARSPLKPKVAQKPADEGLFGDGAYQTDLVDLAGRPNPAKP